MEITLLDITTAILKIDNVADLETIRKATKLSYGTISASNALHFSVGDQVTFNATRGRVVEGFITKINTKTINVEPNSGGRGYRVPAGLLTKVGA